MAFSEEEVAFLRSQPLARIATVDEAGQPDAVPVAFELDGETFWVGGNGDAVLATRKFRNIGSGNVKVALVFDDLPSFEPFVARGMRIYGEASAPVERVGMVGTGHYVQITPQVSWSWNLAGQPAGEKWYDSPRKEH